MGGSVMVLDRWSRALADEGHDIVILTKTAGDGLQSVEEWRNHRSGRIAVCRFHEWHAITEVLKTADRVIMIEMSVRWLVASLAAGKRPMVTHHTHLVPPDGKMRLYRWIQYAIGLCVPAVACSEMIARQWGSHVRVVPNPYDAQQFHSMDSARDVDFLFAGRFGPEKGGLIFVEALAQLADTFRANYARSPKVVIAGKGPEGELMREALGKAELTESVVCFGEASPGELAGYYNRALVVVIPSIWQEPFGLIGLEALACGCRVVCSDQAGLREATGGVAVYCETGNARAFADAMWKCRLESEVASEEAVQIWRHLARHEASQSAASLLGAFD